MSANPHGPACGSGAAMNPPGGAGERDERVDLAVVGERVDAVVGGDPLRALLAKER